MITARTTGVRDKTLEAEAEITLDDGTLIAHAKATMFIMEKA
jgi:acyl-coenzyme A thioesterase PaaI-like protein